MKDLFLTKPSKEYQKSFENYVMAYKKTGDDYYLNLYKKALQNFNEYLNYLNNYSRGTDIAQGEVRTSTFWLIDNNEVVGVVRIRHREVEYAGHIGYDISPYYRNKGYGTEILKLALEEAMKIGIEEAIVTCNINNIASKKIIEKNNGKLRGTIFDEEENEKLYKYSIEIVNNKYIKQVLEEQYKTPEKLNVRGRLHSYNINKIDWNDWCFGQMQIPNGARILELGCGTGDFWYKNRQNLKDDWKVTLSDFSKGMLENTKKNLKQVEYNFTYEEIDTQDIPYGDECFDVVIARHMLYLVPDIEKALSEIKRVLVKGGTFYATTNSHETMYELNELVERFDSEIGLHNNGMCHRFDMESGYLLLKKYFSKVEMDVLQGNIVVDDAETIVDYKASTIRGQSILVGDKRQQFKKYLEDYIKKNGSISITTKSCIFKIQK